MTTPHPNPTDDEWVERTESSVSSTVSSVTLSMAKKTADANTNLVENFFSPFGANKNPSVVYYVIYDWASKVTVFAFNVSCPLLVTKLGDEYFNNTNGKNLWTYLSSGIYIITAICLVTFTSIIEFGCMKRKALVRCSVASAVFLILFVVCYSPSIVTVVLALILSILSKVLYSISNVAYDALLDAVTCDQGRTSYAPHQISSRGFITGYLGMIVFILFALIVEYVAYYPLKVSISLVEGIIPLVLVGLWYWFFTCVVSRGLSQTLGAGPRLRFGPTDLQDDDKTTRDTGNSGIESGPGTNSPVRSAASASRTTFHDGVSTLTMSIQFTRQTDAGIQKISEAPSTCRGEFWFFFKAIGFGFKKGTETQLENIKQLSKYPDLALLFLAFVFLTMGSNTVSVVGAIVVKNILGTSTEDLVICFAIGLTSAILGLWVFRWLQRNLIDLRPKTTIVINVVILAALVLWILFVENNNDLYYIAGW